MTEVIIHVIAIKVYMLHTHTNTYMALEHWSCNYEVRKRLSMQTLMQEFKRHNIIMRRLFMLTMHCIMQAGCCFLGKIICNLCCRHTCQELK